MDNKFLIKTDCTFLIDNFLEKLKRDYKDHRVVFCEDAESFIDTAVAVSLFNNEKKIIILKDLDPDSLDAVAAIVNQDTEDIWVVIQQQTVSRTKAYTVIKGACRLVELKELNDAQCAVWVRKWLEEIQLVFPEDLPSYIVSRVGADISRLHNEMKKVAAYYIGSTERVLTQITCNDFFSENTEVKLFMISENFFRKRVKEVFEDLKRVDDYSLVKLLHILIGQAEKLHKIAVYKEQGMSPEDIGTMLGVPKFIVSTKLLPCLSFFNKTKLIMLLDLFNILDTEMRLTKHSKNLIFESYLLKAMRI